MKRLINSFRFAWRGILIYCRSGKNASIHLFASVVVIVLGIYLRLAISNWCILLLCMTLVHAAEAFNTGLEEVVNFISPQHHHKAEKIKDLAAGAVLITAIGAAITGCLIFGKALYYRF